MEGSKSAKEILEGIKDEIVVLNDSTEQELNSWEFCGTQDDYYQGKKDAFETVFEIINKYLNKWQEEANMA